MRFFVGTNVTVRGSVLERPSGGTYFSVGDRIECEIYLEPGQYITAWMATKFRYPREFADSAYEFTGSVSCIANGPVGAAADGQYTISVSCQGNVAPFKIMLLKTNSMNYVIGSRQLDGPVSNYQFEEYMDQYQPTFRMYAHPNPSAQWGEDWQIRNWVPVTAGSIAVW